jgi:hypothetical protein
MLIAVHHMSELARHTDLLDKQLSTKHTYKTKDRVTRTPLKTGGELRCCEYTNPVIKISLNTEISVMKTMLISPVDV